jgi:ribosomal protein S4
VAWPGGGDMGKTEKRRTYMRHYYQQHKDEIRESQGKYREANREKLLAYYREYYRKKKPEKKLEMIRRFKAWIEET